MAGSDYVADCSIIIRLLASRPGDDLLRQRLACTIHAPALLDAEGSSVVRGLAITGPPEPIMAARAGETRPTTRVCGSRATRRAAANRVSELRHNLTADDAMYVALAETLGLPLLTDDAKFDGTPGHHAEIDHYPDRTRGTAAPSTAATTSAAPSEECRDPIPRGGTDGDGPGLRVVGSEERLVKSTSASGKPAAPARIEAIYSL